MLKFALFDLDDTLYGAESGLWPAIGERIESFMVERMGLFAEEVPQLRRRYFEQYGTTLNGLRAEHQIDPAGYLAYVHDLPLEIFLQPNPALDEMLGRLPLAKAIFTNADAAHARRVTERLGIARHFTTIVDIEALGYCCKPEAQAYSRALELIGAEPGECVFVDDSVRNLIPARALGLMTVLVGPRQSLTPGPSLAGSGPWSPDRDPHSASLRGAGRQRRGQERGGSAPPGVDFIIADILELEDVLIGTGRLPRTVRETA